MTAKTDHKIKNINTVDLRMLLLIVMLSGFSFVRASGWAISGDTKLKHTSDIYVKMSAYVDISTIGWVLLIFSMLLFLSEFVRSDLSTYLLCISTLACSFIHLLFGMISVDSASLFTTYYSNMLVGIVHFLLFITGVIDIWKTKISQTTE